MEVEEESDCRYKGVMAGELLSSVIGKGGKQEEEEKGAGETVEREVETAVIY